MGVDLKIGDIYECVVDDKFYYIQFNSTDEIGDLFQVFHLGSNSSVTINNLNEHGSYFSYIATNSAILKKNGFTKIGNAETITPPKIFKRAGAPDPKTWAPMWWSIFENGKQIARYDDLPHEYRSLPYTETINTPLLIERLKEGWNPTII